MQYALLLEADRRQDQGQRLIRHFPLIVAHVFGVEPIGASEAQRLQMRNYWGDQAPSLTRTKWGHQLHWACSKQNLLSVIIPTRDHLSLLQACLESISAVPAGVDLELIVVDNGSVEPSTLDFLALFSEQDHCHVLRDEGPFNFSALNNAAAKQACGSVLLLLNNDVELLTPQWGVN